MKSWLVTLLFILAALFFATITKTYPDYRWALFCFTGCCLIIIWGRENYVELDEE